MSMILEAQTRTDIGKGASRRLRRLEKKVPAVVYGGDKKPMSLHLLHSKVLKVLEIESIYSSVFELNIDGKTERVILKDLQRHPYKPVILHMDFQRVSAKDILVKLVPLHFLNEETAVGVKKGGVLSHLITQIEVRCQAQNLPAFIEVDVADMDIDDVLHLSQIKLPKNVQLSADIEAEDFQDSPVVSLHIPRVMEVEEETEESEEESEASKEESEASKEEDADSTE